MTNEKRKMQNSFKFLAFILSFALLVLLVPMGQSESMSNGLAFSSKAYAQAIRSFTIIPPTIEKKLSPGESEAGAVKIVNNSDEAVSFTVSLQDFIVEDTQGTPKILPPNTLPRKYSAASWMSIDPNRFVLSPHEKQELNYFISVPKNGRPGGHYAAIIYNPDVGEATGVGTGVDTKVGTLVYIGVKGLINESGAVTKFLAPTLQEWGPVKILTQITNNGDLHIRPQGSISLFDMLGQRVQVQDLSEKNIFPGGVARDYQNSFGGKLMIGRYKASLLASYGRSNNLPLTATAYFWVLPWKLFLLLVLVIITAVLTFLYLKRRDKIIPPPA